MPTRNVVLTEHQENFIEALVRSGRYQNASEVLREGLRLIEKRELEEAAKLDALRGAARLGVSALDRGEFKEFEDASALVAHLNKIAGEVASEGRTRDAQALAEVIRILNGGIDLARHIPSEF